MKQALDFYRTLAGKVREEIPDLNLVMLLYDTPSWNRCRFAASAYLKDTFGDRADLVCGMMMDGGDFSACLSAKYPWPVFSGDRQTRTTVLQVNLDQASFQHKGDPAVITKGMVAHETAHAISGHKRSGYDFWQLYEEEGLADIFNCAVMANERHPEYLRSLMGYRLCSDYRPGVLAISSTEHSFPALLDASAPLAASYAARKQGDFSIVELKREAELIVRRNRPLIKEWRRFASAAMTLADEGYGAGEVLALARAAGSPFVATVEAFSDFRAGARAPRLPQNPFSLAADTDPDRRIERGGDPGMARAMAGGKRWFGHVVMHNGDVVARARPHPA